MATFDKYDDILDLFEQDGRLFATSRDSDGERYQACIMLAETDMNCEDETETGEQDNG